jgi:soluble lytic murein transglycosylase
VERLRRLIERHPGSIWARRATLLIGVLLRDRQPTEALQYLRAAQRGLPFLEDYIRLWIGEALMQAGDLAAAASLLEMIPTLVPDTLLGARVAYRAGEAWYRVGACGYAMDHLMRAVTQEPRDPRAARALLMLAHCQAEDNRSPDSVVTLRHLWTRYPQTPEAQEAERLLKRQREGQPWIPTPDERYARAQALTSARFLEEAVEAYQAFLAAAPGHPKRDEAKLRLAITLARLKRYDQAEPIFHELASNSSAQEAGEAIVWLARTYLRRGEGERLMQLRQAYPQLTLSPEQQALILLAQGTWLEDHQHVDQAMAQYRAIVQLGDRTGQHGEALWRIGWLQYRTGHYREAVRTLETLLAIKEEPAFTPQALYWMARALERLQDPTALAVYQRLCQHYPWTYYCQLARNRVMVPLADLAERPKEVERRAHVDSEILDDVHYRRAVELRELGLEPESDRELAWLVDRYGRDRQALVDLVVRLNEAGGYHQGLRLARLYFRNGLERGVERVDLALWRAAYPMVYLPTIRALSSDRLDPFLAAAIIREESLYDTRAVSPAGAIGLMQLLPETALALAQQEGRTVSRDDLFDQETNIRYGVRYLEQLLIQFNGNLVYTLAAYNAGPRVVTSWIRQFGDREPEEFVEMIPYEETRQYVRHVLRSYREYRRLAGVLCSDRPLDKGCEGLSIVPRQPG